MNRFPDYIRVFRHDGSIYDPFAEKVEPNSGDDAGISTRVVYEGFCKAKGVSQNSMMSISEKANFQIYINDTGVDCQNRDTIFVKTNNEGEEAKMTIIEVKEYEHNTIIWAMRLKDGDDEE